MTRSLRHRPRGTRPRPAPRYRPCLEALEARLPPSVTPAPSPLAGAARAAATPAQQAQVKENFGKLPLYFEQNVGQTDAQVDFLARGPGYSLYLTGTGATMVLSRPQIADAVPAAADPAGFARPERPALPQAAEAPAAVVRLQLVGANAAPVVTGLDQQPGKVNYFLGNNPAQWHTNVTTFGKVQYDDVYPGIGLDYYGSQQLLEYDFVVAPGADPGAIRLNVSGAGRLDLDAGGDLVVQAGGQELREHKPFAYQEVNGARREVPSRFVLDGGQVRFAVAAYDAASPLVIDPVLSYSTYLGGSSNDIGFGIAVDPTSGDVLVTGQTGSSDFPTVNPLQSSYGGGDEDAFVARLSADGSALIYSTYLGGSGQDWGNGIAVDPASGEALVTGTTSSHNFPTANPLQATNRAVTTTAFVARLSADGSALVYSTYLGGSNADQGLGIAVDPASGDALVTGLTASTDFPTANPLQPQLRGTTNAFVARLSVDASTLVYSTYLGGSDHDIGRAIAVDPASGDALVTGSTSSTDFPTANALQPQLASIWGNAFVTRLSADGSAVVYSTYLGGTSHANGADAGYGIAVDPTSGDVLVTGQTNSPDFPTANPLQGSFGGGFSDAFVTRLSADGSALVYSTYLGGSGADVGYGIAVDPASGDALVAGETDSTNFPTANPLQPSNGGGLDAFVARISSPPAPSPRVPPGSVPVLAGAPFNIAIGAPDVGGPIIPASTGATALASADEPAALPEPYPFQHRDPGAASFGAGLRLRTRGSQQLDVMDTARVFGVAAFDGV